jgi:hypothetical protein
MAGLDPATHGFLWCHLDLSGAPFEARPRTSPLHKDAPLHKDDPTEIFQDEISAVANTGWIRKARKEFGVARTEPAPAGV